MYGRLKILQQFLVQLFQASITDATYADLFYLAWRPVPSPKIKNVGLGHHFYIVPFNLIIFIYSLTVSFSNLTV